MNVYVVFGSTGEDSDRSEWVVCAYADEQLAERHVELASEVAREVYSRAEGAEDPWEIWSAASNPYDTAMSMDYPGTTYYVGAAPLLTAIPDASQAPA